MRTTLKIPGRRGLCNDGESREQEVSQGGAAEEARGPSLLGSTRLSGPPDLPLLTSEPAEDAPSQSEDEPMKTLAPVGPASTYEKSQNTGQAGCPSFFERSADGRGPDERSPAYRRAASTSASTSGPVAGEVRPTTAAGPRACVMYSSALARGENGRR